MLAGGPSESASGETGSSGVVFETSGAEVLLFDWGWLVELAGGAEHEANNRKVNSIEKMNFFINKYFLHRIINLIFGSGSLRIITEILPNTPRFIRFYR